jgi:putative ATPase
MANEGYGEDYIYDPDTEEGFSGQDYFPEALGRQEFYRPGNDGIEIRIADRLARWKTLREKGGTR